MNTAQAKEIDLNYKEKNIHYFTLKFFSNGRFRIEKIYLNVEAGKGKLIYWTDWDFTLTQIEEDYHLWVYIGGVADMCREIKLSESEIRSFKKFGRRKIDNLVLDLKKMSGSAVYKKAIKENRKIV